MGQMKYPQKTDLTFISMAVIATLPINLTYEIINKG